MIVTVTVNPAIDHALFVDRLRIGDRNRILRTETDAGGKGINLSRVAAEMGAQTLATGFVGGGPGAFIRRVLDDQGVRHEFVETRGETRTNFSVEDESDGLPTTFNAAGQEIFEDEVRRLFEVCRAQSGTARWAAVGGSLPPGVPANVYFDLARLFMEAGARVLVDADGEPLREALGAGPHLCKPNAKEASRLLGRDIRSIDDAVGAAREIRNLQGRDVGRLTIVSLGGAGAVLASEEAVWVGESPRVETRSTIGSGDSMLGALLWALEDGRSLPEAFQWGLAGGAATAMTDGSEIARRPVVERLFEQARVRRA